jgi:hypothetical protein
MASNVGAKWIIILIIYFMLLTTMVTLVKYVSGGTITTDLNVDKVPTCMEPREIYEPYNIEPTHTTDDSKGLWGSSRYNRDLAHLDCTKSAGVISETYCDNIPGCSWEVPETSFWTNFWSKLGLINSDPAESTCIGFINLDDYNIDRFKSLFFNDWYVFPENEKLIYGNICLHSQVVNNKELCEMVSCHWDSNVVISSLEVDDIKLSVGFLGTLWGTVKEMFTFRFDWGFDNNLINYILTFFTFYLPMIILSFAILVIIRS